MKKEHNAIVVTSIIAGVVLIIAVLALTTFNNVVPSQKNTVTVQGSAMVKAMPDLVSVYYDIETKGTTASEARDAEDVIYNKLVDSLISQGLNESEIQTQSFNVYPNTYWDSKTQKQITDGYKASHVVKVELSVGKMDELSSIVDAGINAGAGISYINFELTQEAQNKYKAQALASAAQDAQIKADSVASGFNKQAGKLISVQVDNFNYYPWNVYTAKADASGGVLSDSSSAREAATSITPSEQEIDATVSATFKLV